MRITGKILLVISLSSVFVFVLGILVCLGNDKAFISTTKDIIPEEEFYAVNDTFYFITNCASTLFYDNVLKNDVVPNSNAQICSVFAPKNGILTFGSNGNFTLTLPEKYSGILEFSYTICDKHNSDISSDATVTIIVENDNDCDGVVNRLDLDNDNDGILDSDEGNGMLDSDSDGIPDNFDIDADNDGISDNEEWQMEGHYIRPSEIDANHNGWDDAYDIEMKGVYYKPEDTDLNGIPDFIDEDSDGDNISDHTEGFDKDGDELADILPVNIDNDYDGLDDAYDIVSCWSLGCNAAGSNSPLPDLNKNGVRDWRENKNKSAQDDPSAKASSGQAFIYPNPSMNVFFINTPVFEEIEKIDLHLLNMQGTEIYKSIIYSGTSQIDLGSISSGSYILWLQSENINSRSIITKK